jgi:hypothetical protein
MEVLTSNTRFFKKKPPNILFMLARTARHPLFYNLCCAKALLGGAWLCHFNGKVLANHGMEWGPLFSKKHM